jgi:hypothetical protein
VCLLPCKGEQQQPNREREHLHRKYGAGRSLPILKGNFAQASETKNSIMGIAWHRTPL